MLPTPPEPSLLRYPSMSNEGEITDLEEAVAAWDGRGWPHPTAMVVSGSGLGVDLGAPKYQAPLSDLLPVDVRSVPGHDHRVELFEPTPGHFVFYQVGRLHTYQGYSASEAVFSIRLAALLGARILLMSNAAGGLRRNQRSGDLVLLRDHLNLTGLNPLRGEWPSEWGPQFPDLSYAYDSGLRRLASRHAAKLGLRLGQGVYAGLPGPSYETGAEVGMLRQLGADVVGMSTVLEVIAARHFGVRCMVISLVTNPATGVSSTPLDHEEVLAAGAAAADAVRDLLSALLADPALYKD